jgi:hypothetical protein
MPVARIYTRFPDEASELAGRLRARGYTVELVDPGDLRVTPADLEIQLDRLKPQEAMAAAARFGRAHDAEIFVAPGLALEEPAVRAARDGVAERGNVFVEGLRKLIAPFRRAGASAHATRAARRQAQLDVELAGEAERKRKVEQTATERKAREREQREKDKLWASERDIVLARQREEDARRQEEERRLAAEREEEDRRQHAEAAARLAAEAAEQGRIAEDQARLERERQAMAAAAAVAAAPRPRRVEPANPRVPRNHRVMQRATIAAAVVAGVLALGWGAYENRTPAQPLSNSELVRGQAIKQDVPFGPASITPQPQQVTANPTPPVRPPQTQAQAKPAQAAPTKASPAPGGKPSPRRKAQQYKSAPDDVKVIAQDEVVYHGAPRHSSGQASATQPQSQVKKYSDLDGPQ